MLLLMSGPILVKVPQKSVRSLTQRLDLLKSNLTTTPLNMPPQLVLKVCIILPDV